MAETKHGCGDGMVWRCSRTIQGARHRKVLSIRDGSIFAKRRLQLRVFVFLLYEWALGTALQQACYELELTKRTVVRHFRLFRSISGYRMDTMHGERLGGAHSVVEVDECQLGRRKSHRGRIAREMWVVGGLERESAPQRIFLEVVRRRNKRTLNELLSRKILLGTRVMTDGWPAYCELGSIGFVHGAVNHSTNFVDPSDPSIHTQGIENVWSCLRRLLRTKGTYTRKDLNGYLREFLFRKLYLDTFEVMLSSIEQRLA
jgi:hypothetical protein